MIHSNLSDGSYESEDEVTYGVVGELHKKTSDIVTTPSDANKSDNRISLLKSNLFVSNNFSSTIGKRQRINVIAIIRNINYSPKLLDYHANLLTYKFTLESKGKGTGFIR